MIKAHHPHDRGERLKIKAKHSLDHKPVRSPLRKVKSEIVEKELDDDLREQVLGTTS